MSTTSSSSSSGGIGFTGLLTIVFITLKLCHVIDWDWIWILSPIWISICLVIVIVIGVVMVAIIADVIKSRRRALMTPEQRSREKIHQMFGELAKRSRK